MKLTPVNDFTFLIFAETLLFYYTNLCSADVLKLNEYTGSRELFV